MNSMNCSVKEEFSQGIVRSRNRSFKEQSRNSSVKEEVSLLVALAIFGEVEVMLGCEADVMLKCYFSWQALYLLKLQ